MTEIASAEDLLGKSAHVVLTVDNMQANLMIEEPHKDVIGSYNKCSYFPKDPEYGFGTGSRPPLYSLEGGPGPGAYVIKTTMGKLQESHIKAPPQYSLKSRQKFGDPYSRAINKTTANEPGPGHYDLTGRFLAGRDPRQIGFPKGRPLTDKNAIFGPGPGSFKTMQSMGKQVLSTKPGAMDMSFPKAARPSLVPVGTTKIGPGEYRGANVAACEPQLDSRKATCASLRFGNGYKKGGKDKKPDLSEPAPGPGSYKMPGSISTQLKGTPFRNAPKISLSGRHKFGSPFA
jgi:hypothetical protein